MALQSAHRTLCAAFAGLWLGGCAGPLDHSAHERRALRTSRPVGSEPVPASFLRDGDGTHGSALPGLDGDAEVGAYVRYALLNNPGIESAYQRWLAAAARVPQAGALPDPSLSVGFFLDEVETRVGAQQGKLGVRQTLPWPGMLRDRADAASRDAMAAWRRFEGARLETTERVISALHDLAYLDVVTVIASDNLELVRSFEQVVRARYQVGAGSHPELVRVQVELGQADDRLAKLEAMRPAYVAALNAVLNREGGTDVLAAPVLPGRVLALGVGEIVEIARRSSPALLALDDETERERVLADAARKDGLPDLTVGLDYILTNDAPGGAIAESGDDPVLLTFGINLPIWREKYRSGEREALARRLALSHSRADEANQLGAALHRAVFEHEDADRRVRLYERSLIPKAEESLRASLAGFRTGETRFIDVLDTERTLLEFSIEAARARSERGKALARINALVGEDVPTRPVDPGEEDQSEETQP